MNRIRLRISCVAVAVLLSTALTSAQSAPDFIRGDCNQDFVVNLGDVGFLIAYAFGGEAAPSCLEACDCDDSAGPIDVVDVIYLLGYLFSGGPPPPVPWPGLGSDPNPQDSLGCGALWLDTGADNSLSPDDSLFEVRVSADRLALSTDSNLINIHSHYRAGSWQSSMFTGYMQLTSAAGGVGVTFLSRYPDEDRYYRLRRYNEAGYREFHIEPHGTQITGGNPNSGVDPTPGEWYRFRILTTVASGVTTIKARVWREGDPEPPSWQINCHDSSASRVTEGTIGCWGMLGGRKEWREFAVNGESIPFSENPVITLSSQDLTVEDEEIIPITIRRTTADGTETLDSASFEFSDPTLVTFESSNPVQLRAVEPGVVEMEAIVEGVRSNPITVVIFSPSSGGSTDPQPMVTHNTISWIFDQPYPVGQFVTGDWYVVGPVTVIGTNPAWNGTHSGSMLNPAYGDDQGYDTRFNYDASLRQTFPVTLPPGSSLVTVRGWNENDSGAPSSNNTLGIPRPSIRHAAVLTVVDAAPPAGSFRPPYAGTDKPIFHTSQLRDHLLPSLSPVAGTPDLGPITEQFEHLWLDHVHAWVGRYLNPSENMPGYGRDIASQYNAGVLMACLNWSPTQRAMILNRLVQIGIDYLGLLMSGANWGVVGGGIGVGRKWPILFAGHMLNVPAMLEIGSDYPDSAFQEDCQTFYLSSSESAGYPGVSIGFPVWGERHCEAPGWYSDPGNTSYRTCFSAYGGAGAVLRAHILGLKDQWNHEALFDYTDWYVEEDQPPGWTRMWSSFTEEMWNVYRNDYGPVFGQ